MKVFVDTSVLVPVFLAGHVHHKPSHRLFTSLDRTTSVCAAHTLVEVYSTLTRMPGKDRISSRQGMLAISAIRDRLKLVSLTADEYANALQKSADLGIVGGGIYDAMLAECAIKAKAETIYTWNTRHFSLCGPEISKLVRTP